MEAYLIFYLGRPPNSRTSYTLITRLEEEEEEELR